LVITSATYNSTVREPIGGPWIPCKSYAYLEGKRLNKTLDNRYYYNEASGELFPNPKDDQVVSKAIDGPVSNCPILVSN